MIRNISRYFIHFLIVIIIQVIVLNNIYLLNVIHPYVYMIFIFFLPMNIPKGLLLIISFFTGVIIDIFSYTYGMHTMATVLIGYIRPYLLQAFIRENINEVITEPHISTLGIRSYAIYAIILIFIHHFVLLFADAFSFYKIFYFLYKVLICTLFSALLVFIYELIAFYKKE